VPLWNNQVTPFTKGERCLIFFKYFLILFNLNFILCTIQWNNIVTTTKPNSPNNFFFFKGKSFKLRNITHFVTYQCVKEGSLFVLFDCNIEITFCQAFNTLESYDNKL
jgi:hypothetical protein